MFKMGFGTPSLQAETFLLMLQKGKYTGKLADQLIILSASMKNLFRFSDKSFSKNRHREKTMKVISKQSKAITFNDNGLTKEAKKAKASKCLNKSETILSKGENTSKLSGASYKDDSCISKFLLSKHNNSSEKLLKQISAVNSGNGKIKNCCKKHCLHRKSRKNYQNENPSSLITKIVPRKVSSSPEFYETVWKFQPKSAATSGLYRYDQNVSKLHRCGCNSKKVSTPMGTSV